MPLTPRVLVALADQETRKAFSRALPSTKIEPVYTSSLGEARRILERGSIAMVVCEDHLADGSFEDMLNAASRTSDPVPVVVTSRVADQSEYLEAMRLGAFDFIGEPFRRDEVEWILEHALHPAPSPRR